MLKVLVLVISVFISSSALAQWSKFEESPEADFYINKSSIRKDGNLRKVWMLQDLKELDKVGGELSRRLRIEFDCKQERSRIVSSSSHTDQMAKGKLITNISEVDKWDDVPPMSVSDTLLKLVCNK
jgi:hypothetical protein